ncbi:hypothetical protein FQR65_LT15382 [Abscondita terminalis]|nr:hypothetical protein FQR65_LT15382 [Abscondita terminalis]
MAKSDVDINISDSEGSDADVDWVYSDCSDSESYIEDYSDSSDNEAENTDNLVNPFGDIPWNDTGLPRPRFPFTGMSGSTYKGKRLVQEAVEETLQEEILEEDSEEIIIEPSLRHCSTRKRRCDVIRDELDTSFLLNKEDESSDDADIRDGQYDSPRYSAKYVTYSIMELKTNQIIDFIGHLITGLKKTELLL